ncbi:MAG: hypothetical protein ACHQDE_10015, partial [Acidimicrobiia bacterium]
LDTAPLLTANDAVDLVGSADLVLLVARSGETSFSAAARAVALLGRLDAPLAGVLVAGVKAVSNDYYYYYQRDRVDGRKAPRRADGKTLPASNGNGSAPPDDLFAAADGAIVPEVPVVPADGPPHN